MLKIFSKYSQFESESLNWLNSSASYKYCVCLYLNQPVASMIIYGSIFFGSVHRLDKEYKHCFRSWVCQVKGKSTYTVRLARETYSLLLDKGHHKKIAHSYCPRPLEQYYIIIR
jgi:hypothetical protein